MFMRPSRERPYLTSRNGENAEICVWRDEPWTGKYLIPLFLFAFVILLTVPALAQEGGHAIGACTVIDKSGSYVLAKNITATQRDLKTVPNRIPACIVIVADFVSLDLQGYTITGPGWEAVGPFGISVTGNASDKWPSATHIRNGCVTNFERGINVEGLGHTVEGVRVYGNNVGITLDGDGHRVKDAVAISNWTGIICWSWRGLSVEHSQISSNTGSGISLWFDSENRNLGSRIVGNTVVGKGEYGIHAPCPSLILQNMVYKNGWGDIVIEGSGCTQSDNNPAP